MEWFHSLIPLSLEHDIYVVMKSMFSRISAHHLFKKKMGIKNSF